MNQKQKTEGTVEVQEGALVPTFGIEKANELAKRGISTHFCKKLTFVRIPLKNDEAIYWEDINQLGTIDYIENQDGDVRVTLRGIREASFKTTISI